MVLRKNFSVICEVNVRLKFYFMVNNRIIKCITNAFMSLKLLYRIFVTNLTLVPQKFINFYIHKPVLISIYNIKIVICTN